MNGNTKKALRLSLKRQWFEMTKAGIKTEDYREINSYWACRLLFYSKKPNANTSYWKIFDGFTRDYLVNCLKNSIKENHTTFKPFTHNTMTLGYPKSTDTERIIKFEHAGIEIRTGNPEWGAEPNKIYFVIKHGKRIQ